MRIIAIVIVLTTCLFSYCQCYFKQTSIFPRLALHPTSTALGLTTADFKNGMTFEVDNVPVKLLEFLHVKPGKGSAFVRTKIKNLISGTTQERTFRAGESIVLADVSKTEMQYTFTDGNFVCFMNMETFEEQRVEKSKIGNIQLMKEGLPCLITIWGEVIVEVSLPQTVEYVVMETPPDYKGNSGSGVTKPALLDSGATVQVPMFIEPGEKIIVSTDDVKYVSRAKKE